jgi:hypothetical protein
MAISKLVKSGQSFDRPSVSAFFGKSAPANDNLQKKSDMFTGGNFVSSITNMLQQLNSQLHKLQETSQKTILAFNKIIKDIRDVKKDIVSKFRIVNNELNSNKLDFVNGIRGVELPKPIQMPEPGTPVPASAPAAAAATTAAPAAQGPDIWDLLAGAGIGKDLVKGLVSLASSPIGAVLFGGAATFGAFAAAMFGIASVADYIEDKLGLKELYKKRMETQEYKDMQDTQAKITEDARKTNVDKGDRIKMFQKTLDDNKLQKKDVKTLQGDIITTVDGRQFDIKTQKPVGETQETNNNNAAGAPSATAAATSPTAPAGGDQNAAPAGGSDAGASASNTGGNAGAGSPAATPSAAATPPAAASATTAPAPTVPPTAPTAPAPTVPPTAPTAPATTIPTAPAPMPAPAQPQTGTGGVGSIQAPGAPTPVATTPAPPAPPPPSGTPVLLPPARPTGEELKSIGGIERSSPTPTTPPPPTPAETAQQNVAAIQNPMALMANKMEAAKQIDAAKPTPSSANMDRSGANELSAYTKQPPTGQQPLRPTGPRGFAAAVGPTANDLAQGPAIMNNTPGAISIEKSGDIAKVKLPDNATDEQKQNAAKLEASDKAQGLTPKSPIVGSGRGSVIEKPGARALAQEIGSGRGSGEAELAQRKKDAAPKPKSAPIATPAVDPHAKSKALFQEVLDIEKQGGNSTAKYFEADKQRTAELEALKNTPPPGTPAKKAEQKPKKEKEMSAMDKMRMGRGAGDHTAPVGLGDESAGYTGAAGNILQTGLDQQAALNAGPEPGYTGKGGKVLQSNLDESAEIEKQQQQDRANAAQKMQAVDDADMARAPGERATMAADQSKIEAIKSGASTPAQVRGSMRQAVQQIGPNAADLAPPPKNEDTGTGEPVVQNNNQTQNSGSSSGGEGNNVAGQNLPMKATNDWLKDFIERQQVAYQ